MAKCEICNMRILLAAATSFEVDTFIKKNTNVEVLICGVGTPLTIYHLTAKLARSKVDLAIQAGIAGAFSPNLEKGEVVLVKKDAFADVGVEEKGEFKTMFQLGFADKDTFPFTDGWLVNDHYLLQTSHLKAVTAITINRLSDRLQQTAGFRNLFDADIESMEGAALHYVCMQMNVPFVQMRSISNEVGERDKSKWNIRLAIENLNTELINLTEKLSNS